ncbi:MAG: restriction endonuclease subunit M [Mesorhizobium sp.]|uniref:Eco57I restriction-modification methylase domain-containing protein n=1 Tax=Mesorhizobium sp. TaxID=1871066 RepID=UPI000FE663C3|nr:DNA methyltransferase [Mesorhizobium sp.]RWL90977.1 MAG: restriction endonuclease subunit M [Mesorhizobium sp.]TIP45713.1 MAG: restriction endonuclease subunit M [Mesorhizobium sp.]TJV68181.1 MAG: restriction endonuclease subunit M [Mesorhizobium sp.]
MQIPDKVLELIERFHQHKDIYTSHRYNEAQTRQEFIDPLFDHLGWDMGNLQGFAEAYKDVVHEDAIKVGGLHKAPDYSFRVGGVRKFFLEAKKPSTSIKDDAQAAFQLRRYGWSAKLGLSLLTNFREIAVYDCRVQPTKTDKASTARVKLIRYDELPERWAEFATIFSKQAVYKGSFDAFDTGKVGKKKGTTEVDAAFLDEIERWRDELARNLALRNEALNARDLNYAVQVTIDRIVFLRICEDRGIERYGRLKDAAAKKSVYSELLDLFREADARYNSGLFHFKREKDVIEQPDTLTPTLSIDDKLLKRIISDLYYPDCPYEFSMVPSEILGQVYEQFLGRVVRITGRRRAVVEEKPEVKKAGGVYYTPAYIVDYIVQQTIGQLVRGKTPADVSKLRILDPACGSGSFLLGAYQFLLDWHLKWYVANSPEKHKKALYKSASGAWKLSIDERKRILLGNIYGVDIDRQAVEVTKLSLLLKVLEDETGDTLKRQYELFRQRALPDLGANIRCGNSLIGPDFRTTVQLDLLSDDQLTDVNVFDWRQTFPKVFADGGFSAAIGNPPYVNAWTLFESAPHIRDYINSSTLFESADRHWDLYVLFIEKALEICRPSALIGMIIPYSYAIQKYAALSRSHLLNRTEIRRIADLRTIKVFGKVPVITMIPIVQKKKPKPRHIIQIDGPSDAATAYHPGTIEPAHEVAQARLLTLPETMLRIDFTEEVAALVGKIERQSIRFGELAHVNYGAQMSSKRKGGFGKEHVLRDTRVTATCRKTIAGRDLYRYQAVWNGKYVEWALAHEMYGPRAPWFFEGPKIMIRDITGTHRIESSLDQTGLYCDHTILCAHRFADISATRMYDQDKVDTSARYSLALLQGLVASRLVSAYYYWTLTGEGVRTGGGFHTYPTTVRALPIASLELLDKPANASTISEIERLATRLAETAAELNNEKSPSRREQLSSRFETDDARLDALIYKLYALGKDEIALIEAATA